MPWDVEGPHRRDGRAVLHLSGDLDPSAALRLPELLHDAVAAHQDLDLDVAGVGRVCVDGLRVLAREQRRRAVRGGALRLVRPGPGMRRLLAGAGMLDLTGEADALPPEVGSPGYRVPA